jgi:hypothetical protein
MGNKDAYTEAYEIGLRQGEAKRTDLERRLREAEADAEGFRHAMLSTEASLHTAWDERDAARRWAKRWKRVAKVKLEWGRKCKAALLKQRQRADDLAAQNAALRAVAEAAVALQEGRWLCSSGVNHLQGADDGCPGCQMVRALAAARAAGALKPEDSAE